MKLIGTVVERDYNHGGGIYTLETKEGRRVKLADLVDDDPKTRAGVYTYLSNMKKADDMDFIIALGTAKEGFDWEWCDTCLTVGVRVL